MLIRPRRGDDIAACVALLREVHELDSYPRYLPGDPESFLLAEDAYGCWVAELDGAIVGHVALVKRTSAAAMKIASDALGRPADELGVVARLFVSGRARRSGAGRRLLGTATAEATARGLWPVLDVTTDAAAAIALYERTGWTRAGTTTVRFRDGHTLDEHIYLGPAPLPRLGARASCCYPGSHVAPALQWDNFHTRVWKMSHHLSRRCASCCYHPAASRDGSLRVVWSVFPDLTTRNPCGAHASCCYPQPEDIAETVYFLASAGARHIAGQILHVKGAPTPGSGGRTAVTCRR